MSWSLKKKSQVLLDAEQGTVRKDWGGKISVALVYPNTYAVGMSNLGFQTIYRHLNAIPDVVCERVFVPESQDLEEMRRSATPPFSLESLRPLTDFHLVGFSVTYEGDYINVLRLLAMAGIPLRATARRAHDPLVLMGGVCAFSNPEPIAPFMDFVVVGEGEELVVELIDAYRERYHDRAAFLASLATLDGIYVPGQYDVAYGIDGTLEAVAARDAAPRVVVKRRLRSVNAFETIAAVKTPHAEYGHMALLEVGKGCGRGCRFCLEGQVYRPVRHRSVDALRETVARVAASGEKRVGLVGACVSDYPWIGELLKIVEDHGLELSISSFVPKPWTPFQWAPFAGAGALQAKLEIVKHGVRRLHNVRVLHENPREAALQALLARGDRRVADFLELAASFAGDWRRALREWKGDPDFCTTRVRSTDERLPWDHFDVGVKKAGLIREWERAQAELPVTSGAA